MNIPVPRRSECPSVELRALPVVDALESVHGEKVIIGSGFGRLITVEHHSRETSINYNYILEPNKTYFTQAL